MNWIIPLAVLVIIVAAGPFLWARISEKPLTADVRRRLAPGQSVELSNGTIHYRIQGPEDGPVVVLVHGFSAPNFVFEQTAEGLAEAGFRVIRFDHFGRGWSDRPAAAYDPEFYDGELLDLFNALDLQQPVGLVGYSMGGVIAAEFTARYPERVAGLFLLTPAGLALNLFNEGLVSWLIDIPLLGDWYWRLRGQSLLAGDPQYDDSSLPAERRLHGDVREQMAYQGYLPAILSSWRHLPMRDRDSVFAEAAATGVPMMAVFGGRDPVIGSESAARLRAAAPQARIETIADGDHGLTYELFDEVNPMLIGFFRRS